MPNKPKIAIVHDWLTTMGGAEKTVLALHEAFPDAPIYTSVYTPSTMPAYKGLDIRTTWLQKLPSWLTKVHKFFPVLRVWAFRSLDLSAFDIIIVSSSAESKQIKKHPGQTVICYCHTPIRYYWSHYHEYKRNPGFGKLNWLIRLLMPLLVPPLKKADYKAAQNMDIMIANSSEVQSRIKKYYQRTATVVHPPVEVDRFTNQALNKNRHGFVIVGRQVLYKRVDLAVAACTELALPLTVYGNGSEHERLKKIAGPTITFITNASDKEVAAGLGKAEAFIFPAEEDFGIVQVEALAAGTPVIGFNKGGTTEIVEDGVSGVLFNEQTVESLKQAIARFQTMEFLPATLHRKAKRFHKTLFISKMQKIVADQLNKR
ncbi:MAG TPA: glycosyltransferase [Verrucomicrobiae bacterium]|nr:glycosyltransferase [Verrucomicrobiae bacterium]